MAAALFSTQVSASSRAERIELKIPWNGPMIRMSSDFGFSKAFKMPAR
jgi:hypothetical protein